VVSNLGVWLAGFYPRTVEGLVQCYVMAIPFFGSTLLGDLFYAVVLFGLYEAARTWAAKRQRVTTPS
jgi:hypothetical protein